MPRLSYILDGQSHTIELGEGSHILGRAFETVKVAKPDASRDESIEVYLVALGFHGPESDAR